MNKPTGRIRRPKKREELTKREKFALEIYQAMVSNGNFWLGRVYDSDFEAYCKMYCKRAIIQADELIKQLGEKTND